VRAAGVRPTAVPRTGAPGTRRSGIPSGPVGVTGALTGALDRTGLARFSTGRYLAIWSVFLIIFLGAILFLIYSGQTKPAALPKYMVVETTKGTFKVQFYTDPADKVVDVVRNFADKARSGTFNGRTFHRVEDWVIQGGDPLGTGTGGGSISAEYNQKPFLRGAVGVASTAGGGSQINDSQWFVVKTDATYLNGQYSNFGQVVEGMDVVDKIVKGDKMTKVTVADQ
jgi:cyclophilin family peptidyl-prolyl cis-trans isomerase